MLTPILVIAVEATSQGHYRIRYLPVSTAPDSSAHPASDQVSTPAASRLKPKVATVSLTLCSGHLISPGLCLSVRLNFSGNSNPTVTHLADMALPKHLYSWAIQNVVDSLPLPINHQLLTRALLKIGEHPALLARLLDSPTPAMLEYYFDQYSALKLHQAWHARKALEAAVQHLSSLNLPTRLAPNLCSVQLPLTSQITYQRLVLDVQTKVLSTQEDFFRIETRLLLWLTYARSQGVSLVDRDQLITTLKSSADCIGHALMRLEANRSVKLVNSKVMLSTEYYLELSLQDALTRVESYSPPPQFYAYEIDDCVERASLQRRTPPSSSVSAVIRQCLNHRISTVYTSPATMLRELVPLLSLISQQLLNSRPIIVAPAAYAVEQAAAPYGEVVALAHLKTCNFSPKDTIIIALDADTYSKYELLTMLNAMTASHRLLIHGTSFSGLPHFVSKTQHLISRAYPFITLNDELFTINAGSRNNIEHVATEHLRTSYKMQSTRVYFDIDLSYLFRLLIKTKAVAFVPSSRQALKLSRLLHTRRKRTTGPSFKIAGAEFFAGDRVIFFRPQQTLNFDRNPIGVILSVQKDTVLLSFSGALLPITAEAFINSNPSPCYFLSTDQFKRTLIEKSIIIFHKGSQADNHYMLTANYRSNIKVGIVYGVKNLTINQPRRLPIEDQTMTNFIPNLIEGGGSL